jgi:sulfur carrier protein
MTVVVNGAPRDLAEGTTLAEVVAQLTSASTGIAVAVNDNVVPRGAWSTTRLVDRDRVEVLTAVQGG